MSFLRFPVSPAPAVRGDRLQTFCSGFPGCPGFPGFPGFPGYPAMADSLDCLLDAQVHMDCLDRLDCPVDCLTFYWPRLPGLQNCSPSRFSPPQDAQCQPLSCLPATFSLPFFFVSFLVFRYKMLMMTEIEMTMMRMMMCCVFFLFAWPRLLILLVGEENWGTENTTRAHILAYSKTR